MLIVQFVSNLTVGLADIQSISHLTFSLYLQNDIYFTYLWKKIQVTNYKTNIF